MIDVTEYSFGKDEFDSCIYYSLTAGGLGLNPIEISRFENICDELVCWCHQPSIMDDYRIFKIHYRTIIWFRNAKAMVHFKLVWKNHHNIG